jgi:hypothetical protein
MKDQYDNDIPNDLVLIPDINGLDETQIKMVDDATWYEQNGVIMVSAKEIDFLSEDDPIDAGIILTDGEIFEVNYILHRYNRMDGFYHA